jgi:hypothetical protein
MKPITFSHTKVRQLRIRMLTYVKTNMETTTSQLRGTFKLGLSAFFQIFSILVKSQTVVKTRTKPRPTYRIGPKVEHLSPIEQLKRVEELTRLWKQARIAVEPTVLTSPEGNKVVAIKGGATAKEREPLDRFVSLWGAMEPEPWKPGGIVLNPGDRFMTIGQRAAKIVTREQLLAIGYRVVKRKTDEGPFASLEEGYVHLPMEDGFMLAPLIDETGDLVAFSFLYRLEQPEEGAMIPKNFVDLAMRIVEGAKEAEKQTTHARIFDMDTKEITEVPKSELAPGFILSSVEGVEGEVYVDASKMKDGTIKHPPFDAETRSLFKLFSKGFKDVYPRTVAEWEDGFRRDAHPMKEIKLWANIGGAFGFLTKGKKMSVVEKRDIFHIIVAATNVGADDCLHFVKLEVLSREKAQEIVALLKKGNPPKQ